MSLPRRRFPALLLVATALMAGGPGALAQSPDASLPRSNVSDLVTFVPPSAETVGFTDWGRIKASQGAQDVTGSSPIEDKFAVGLSTAQDEAAASGFGFAHLRDHFDTWAFDGLDLAWEATIQGSGPPMFVLRFRDGFDLAPVAALFDERGFTTAQIPGGVLRTHELSLTDDWLRATEFAILNTAFLDDGRTLVLSGDAAQVQDLAANHGQFPVVAGLDATGAALDGASAALFLLGVGTCVTDAFRAIGAGTALASSLPSPATAGLHPYAALGIGYGRPDWSPMGRISFGYVDPATASADLTRRLDLATTGLSQRVRRPYPDVLFRVVDSRVDGANLTFDVAPKDDLPRLLFDMAYSRDMLFAGC